MDAIGPSPYRGLHDPQGYTHLPAGENTGATLVGAWRTSVGSGMGHAAPIMDAMQRVAAIMAGGSGERFWPVSRADRPKQLLKLGDPRKSLLAEAVERVKPGFGDGNVFVLTSRPIEAAVKEAGLIPSTNVVAEPDKRNTLGCLCWFAARLIAEGRADTSIAVLTADHKIGAPAQFLATLDKAFACAESTGALVTLGIRPTRPETGYGYIETARDMPEGGGAWHARSFREKPDITTAIAFLNHGDFLWNSGMFVWTLSSFLNELCEAAPEPHRLTLAMAAALRDGDSLAAEAFFRELPSISIDFALMEKAKSVIVVEADFPWDDVGSWDALLRTLPSDDRGNATIGDVLLEDTDGCVVYADDPGMAVCLLGVQDLVVVQANGVVMVCHKDGCQEVRRLVARMKEKGDLRV